MAKKLLLTIWLSMMVSFLFFSGLQLVSAELPSVKQNQCFNILVTSNCTQVNITDVSVYGSTPTRYLFNIPMTKNGQTFNYTFCNTTQLGEYTYSWNPSCESCANGVCGNSFMVSLGGDTLSSGSSLLYTILIIINFSLFMFFIVIAYKIDGNNYRDEEGLITVNNKKYLKMGCFFMSYILMTWFIFNLYTISNNYLSLTFMANFFWAGWILLGWGLVVVIPAYFIFNIVWLFVDAKWRDMWQKQIPCLDD